MFTHDCMHFAQFLMALNDEFELVRVLLLYRDPLPSHEAIVLELLTEYTQLAIHYLVSLQSYGCGACHFPFFLIAQTLF